MIADLPILPPAPAEPATARPGRETAPSPASFEALVTGEDAAAEATPAPPRRPVKQAPPNGDPGLVAAVVQLPLPVLPVDVPPPGAPALAAGPTPAIPGQAPAPGVPGTGLVPTAVPGVASTTPAPNGEAPGAAAPVSPSAPGVTPNPAASPQPLAASLIATPDQPLPTAMPAAAPVPAGGVALPKVTAQPAPVAEAPAVPTLEARPSKPGPQALAADPSRPTPVVPVPKKDGVLADPLVTALPAGPGAAAVPVAEGEAGIHAPHRATQAAPPPPSAQVLAKLEPALAEGRPTTLTLRLTPEELGRVEVRIEVQDGKVNAMVAADRQSTLDLLQRDARGMERALEQGGLKLQPDGLQFSLRDAPRQDQPGQQPSPQGGRAYRLDQAEAEPGPLTPVARRLDGLVDIQV